MKTLLKKTIKNHPIFPNIKREVVVYGANIDGRFSQIVLDAEVHYFDTEKENLDITQTLNYKLKDWNVTNKDFTTMRDNKGLPLKNSDYVSLKEGDEDTREENQKEEYQKAPSFDYFFNIIKNPKSPSLILLLEKHIEWNDENDFFDKLLNIPV